MLATLQRLWGHLAWADDLLLAALEQASPAPAEGLREYAHILGADETWLARLQHRPASVKVWPEMTATELRRFAGELHAQYAAYLSTLDPQQLAHPLAYSNSLGQSFVTPVQEILLHVAMHAQYHRGKVNLLLRTAGLVPVPVDYIAYVRGVPAAVTPPPR